MWARSSCTLQIPRMVVWGSWISTLEPSGGEAKLPWDEATKRSTKGWSGCHDAWAFLCFSILFGLLLLVVHWLNFGGTIQDLVPFPVKRHCFLPKWCRPIISVEFWSWCLLLKGCWKIMIVWLSCFSLSLIFVDLQLSYCSGLWQGVPPQTRQPWWDSLALLRDSEAKRDMYVMVMMMVMIIIFGWFCYKYRLMYVYVYIYIIITMIIMMRDVIYIHIIYIYITSMMVIMMRDGCSRMAMDDRWWFWCSYAVGSRRTAYELKILWGGQGVCIMHVWWVRDRIRHTQKRVSCHPA